MSNFFNTLFGIPGKSKSGQVNIPDFQVDPYYDSSQKTLSGIGTDVLSGNVPDYFKPIGDFNSPEFQAMLGSVTKNISQGVANQSAISGTARSGVTQSATSDALSNVIPNLTYADYMRGIEGRKGLLDFGANTLSGVRGGAVNQESLVNSYNTNKYKAQLDQAQYLDAYDIYRNGQVGKMYGQMIDMGLGMATGGMTGGLGSISGNSSGISSFLDMLGGINKSPGGVNGASGGTYEGLLSQLGSF